MWTKFWDMHSGGGTKLNWEIIYIEAPEKEAIEIFMDKFGRDPFNVTCDCCGDDYSVSSEETIEAVTAYDRKCEWDGKLKKYVDTNDSIKLFEYLKDPSVTFIFSKLA